MKKLVQVAGLCCLLAAGSFGQRMGYGGFRGGHARGGGFGRGFGFSRGFVGFRGFSHHRFFRSSFFPSAFPLYYGGYGYAGYNDYNDTSYAPYAPYAQAPAANVTVIYLPPAPSYGPQIVSTSQYEPQRAQPMTREYPDHASAPPAAGRAPIYFQIATKDGSVYAALAYWVQDGLLHYVDLDEDSAQVPVNAVDRERSEKLNKAREVDFRLPMPR
jgi:hypothetical protein